MARRTTQQRTKRPSQRTAISDRYRATVGRKGKPNAYEISLPEKRAAIRWSHTFARKMGPGARCDVRARGGALIYQATFQIIAGHPRFVVEEL